MLKYFLAVFVFVVVSGDDSSTFLVRSPRNESQEMDTSTYKYPTATWSAKNYEMKKKKYDPEMMIKLFLFKPSPFLKPPFTDGSVGSSITTIEDGVNVSGRRRGKIKAEKIDQAKKPFIQKLEPKNSRRIDMFLAEALMNYVKSANLTDEFGTITVEEFSDALRKVTENRKSVMIYEENKDMRRKFRDDVLNPKRTETTTSSGILEKQYQRRLQKTWEVINENISVPSRSATLDRRIDWEMDKPRETQQIQVQPDDAATSQYLYSHITQSTPLTTSAAKNSYGNWPTSETIVDYQQETEKFRVSETGWRDVIPSTSTTPESILAQADWPTENYDSNEISLTTPEPVDETPTTFRPIYSSDKKKEKKVFRGKKKWRDTLPAAQEISNWDDGEVKLSVAETVYYRPRQTQLESFKYQSTAGAIPGEPETDYPMLGKVPSTGFKCPKTVGENTVMIADRKARCQVWPISEWFIPMIF